MFIMKIKENVIELHTQPLNKNMNRTMWFSVHWIFLRNKWSRDFKFFEYALLVQIQRLQILPVSNNFCDQRCTCEQFMITWLKIGANRQFWSTSIVWTGPIFLFEEFIITWFQIGSNMQFWSTAVVRTGLKLMAEKSYLRISVHFVIRKVTRK